MSSTLYKIALLALAIPTITLSALAEPVIVIDDFENDLEGWRSPTKALTSDTETVKSGLKAGRFLLEEKAYAERSLDVQDWTDYEGLSFWVYSASETPAVMGIALNSENPGTEGWVYFFARIEINWSGWKQFLFRKGDFLKSRDPSWEHIKSLRFSVTDWPQWSRPSPGDSIVIDDIRLLNAEQMKQEEAQ